ncbi:MAG: anthrax toxin-like adenylyl cyclase domain-containing protein [Gammaproteobacteria bacterium]
MTGDRANRRAGPLAVLLACGCACSLVLSSTWLHTAGAQEDDWEARAARAAAEDAPVDTGGAPGTRIPVDRPPPPAAAAPDPDAHIRAADRKVAEQHARELAARRAAEQEAIAPLVDQLSRGRAVHAQTLRDLRDRLGNLQTRLDAAKQDKARAEAAIKAYDDNVDWLTGAVETVGGALGGRDPEAEAAANKQAAERTIAELEAQMRNVTSAYEAEVAEAQGFERRLGIEIAKRQEDARAALASERLAAARELAVAYHTEAAVLAEGAREFEQRILLTDVAIRQAERNGLADVAEQFRKDKARRTEAYAAWLERHNAILAARRADLDRSYAQNRADGIGPTNDYLLASRLRTQARANGEDPLAATNLVDQDIVTRSRESAASVVEGAPGTTEHLSIFTEVSSESLLEFARTYGEEAGKTYGSWEGFYNRVLRGAVWGTLKGVGNLVKDLFLLLVELGDTAGEGLEDIVERLSGAELDLFGDENLAALRSFAVTARNLTGDDDQAAMEELDRLVAAAEAIGRTIKRKTEQMAATEEGIVRSIQLVQEGAVNVVGVETVAVQGFTKGAKLLRGVNRVDELAEVGIAAERAGDAASVTGRAEDVAGGGARAADAAPAPRTGLADEVVDAPSASRAPDSEVDGAAAVTQAAQSCPVGQRRLDFVSRVRSKLARLRSNIVPSHGEVFVDVAVKRNEVVMVRPVNQFSTRLISDNFATKNMGIKGKSADWGPQRGTIPVDPRYSKLGNPKVDAPSAEQLRIYENYNRRALGMEYQTPAKSADGEIIRTADGAVAEWVTHAPEPPIAKAVPYQGPDGETIQVLADINTGKPITADYDLFAVGTQKGHGEVLPFDPDLGVISETEMATVEWINEGAKAKGYTGGNVAHHGPANRFEKTLSQKADFPVTAFTPDGNVHTINSIEELNDFYNTWRALGYDLPAHPDWPLDPDLAPSGRFGPLAEDPTWAARAAAAGLVTTARASGADSCAAPDSLLPFAQDDVYAPDDSGSEPAGRPVTGSGGSSAAQTAVSVGGDFPPAIPAIQFEFGPGFRSWLDDSWISPCPPTCDDEDIARRFLTGPFEVSVEQVFNQFGNAPFDPDDPLGGSLENDAGSDQDGITVPAPTTPVTPNTPSTPSAPSTPTQPTAPGNPLSSYGGNYTGNGGCGINATTFATSGSNAFTLTLPPNGAVPFDLSGNAGDSRSNDLVIFGAPGHSCGASGFSNDNQFNLNCNNTGGGSCNESFTR